MVTTRMYLSSLLYSKYYKPGLFPITTMREDQDVPISANLYTYTFSVIVQDY